MPIEVDTPDGIAEFPDGTDEATITSALRRRFSPQQSRDLITRPEFAASDIAEFGSPAYAEQVQNRTTSPLSLMGTPFDSPGFSIPKLGQEFRRSALDVRQAEETDAIRIRASDLGSRFDAILGLAGDNPLTRGSVLEARQQSEDELNLEASSKSLPFRILNESNTPILPQIEKGEVEGLTEVQRGASNFASSFLEILKDPMVLAGIGLAKAAPATAEVIGRAFGLQMLTHSPEQVKAIYDAYKAGDTGAATEALLNLGATAYLGPKLIKGHGSKAEQLAKYLEKAVKDSKLPEAIAEVVPNEQASRLNRFQVTPEPFLQPGVRELADAALKEAQSPIVRTDPAIDRLRASMNEIENPQFTAPRERIVYEDSPPQQPAQPLRTAENIRLSQSEAPEIKVRDVERTSTPISDIGSLERDFFQRLENRDMVAAIDLLRGQPVEVSRKIVDQVNQVGKNPVDLSVAERTIFNELWEKVYKDSLKGTREPIVADAAGRLEQLKKKANPTPEEITERDALQSNSDSLKQKAWPGFERAIETVESLQAKLRKGAQSGDTLMGVPSAILDTALEAVRLSLKAGKSLAEAIDDGMKHIRYNVKGVDIESVRSKMLAEFERAPVKPVGTALTDKTEMRTLSERATTSEKIPEPVQEKIQSSPESYYQVQSLKGVEQAAKTKTDAELGSTQSSSDAFTADKLELSARLLDSGKHEEGYRVFQDLSAELTRMGQVINQAKLFQALRPEHVVTVVNKDLVRAGKDPLTLEQAGRVEGVAKERIKAQSDLGKATDEWVKNPTDANAVKAETALDQSNKAAVSEQSLVNQFKPRTTPSLLKTLLQLNLLTPISQVANVIGNVNFMPFRSTTRSGATAIDILDSAIRNRPRQIASSPIAGTKAAARGLARGVSQVPGILARGSSESIKGEVRTGLHPLRAWVKQFAKNPDIPTEGGKIPFSERVNLAIEGTFGVPAEVMGRLLSSGDIPFVEMARARLISEQSRLSKLNPSQSKMAERFPELFFDKATLNRIENETRGAVFQRHSKTLDHLTSAIKGKGDWLDLLVATVAPYKLTPWNIVGEILSYNPLIALGRTLYDGKKGNTRGAEMNAAKMVVGSALVYAGYWLYQKGLIAPSMDSSDEQQKARVLAGEVLPPNHINLSGLKRAMNHGDPSFQPGDETVDVFRGGGLAGSMFYMMANIGRDAETQPQAENAIMSVLKNSTLEQARFGVNQSFLKGVTGLLQAVREGEADNYLQSWIGTVTSIPLPNTLSALSRAEREYKVDASGSGLKKQVENVVRTRLGFAGLDDLLPMKRGLWGEPLRETPKDANALVYHFFDISKNKQVTSDPLPLELYRLWRKTASTTVIPTPPEKTITVRGQTFLLNPEQRSRYAELVGSERREIASKIVVNPNWHKASDEQKIKYLDEVYRTGLERGKAKFWKEVDGKLEKKPAKAGFK